MTTTTTIETSEAEIDAMVRRAAMLAAHEVCGELMAAVPLDISLYRWAIRNRSVKALYRMGNRTHDEARADIRVVAELFGLEYRERPETPDGKIPIEASGSVGDVLVAVSAYLLPHRCVPAARPAAPAAAASIDETAELEGTPARAVATDATGTVYAAAPLPVAAAEERQGPDTASAVSAEELERAGRERAHRVCGELVVLIPDGVEICAWTLDANRIEGQHALHTDDADIRASMARIADALPGFVLQEHLSDDGTFATVQAVGDVGGVRVVIWDHVKPTCTCASEDHAACAAPAAVSS